MRLLSLNTAGTLVILITGFIGASPAVHIAGAGATTPVAEQNALVQKHCAVCHTDAARDGGLSLEHFDAAQVSPSLAAMMLSKLTSGVPLETVKAVSSDPNAAALVAQKLGNGAIQAAGVPVTDMTPVQAFAAALAFKATNVTEWHMGRNEGPVTSAPVTTASILREQTRKTSEAESYRLVLTCNGVTHEGAMQLAWSPVAIAKTGMVSVAVDGKTPTTYKVEPAGRTMGNGTGTAGTAAIKLYESNGESRTPSMSLPAQTLTVSDLFPNETVAFPFSELPQTVRQALAPCFSGRSADQ